MRNFEIVWDLSTNKYWDYLKQFRIEEFPEYKFLTSGLRTGYGHDDKQNKKLSHILLMDGHFYFTAWGCGPHGDESWSFYRVYDVDKFLNDEYSYWELIGDSFENFDYYYKISFSTRYGAKVNEDLDVRMSKTTKSYSTKYKIPTDKICRNCLPAEYPRSVSKNREEEENEIRNVLSGKSNHNPGGSRINVTEMLSLAGVRELKLMNIFSDER